MIHNIPYEGSNLPFTKEELFQLAAYPIINKKEAIEAVGSTFNDDNYYQDLIHMLHARLPESEKEFISAHESNDWKKIAFLADRERDGALYTGSTRLHYSCQFLEQYFVSNQTELLEALYEQAINVMHQTEKAIEEYERDVKLSSAD